MHPFGCNNRPVNVATKVNAVTMAGLNGNGKEIYAEIHNKAVNKAILLNVLFP